MKMKIEYQKVFCQMSCRRVQGLSGVLQIHCEPRRVSTSHKAGKVQPLKDMGATPFVYSCSLARFVYRVTFAQSLEQGILYRHPKPWAVGNDARYRNLDDLPGKKKLRQAKRSELPRGMNLHQEIKYTMDRRYQTASPSPSDTISNSSANKPNNPRCKAGITNPTQ